MILRESIKSKFGFRLFVMMALATAAIWAWSQSSFAQQGGVARYFYDANGRLTTVLSPTGEAVTYQYDPAGNFTSITRRAANELSIIEFTPGAGGPGTQVTIYGTGFSETPSANTVTFNGMTATVTAATKIQLTVNVPMGATTGPINISNANGSVNSSGNFYVSGNNVEFILPIAFGQSAQFSFATPPSGELLTNVGMLTFDGVANQRVSVLVADLDFCLFRSAPLDFVYAQVSIVSPSGAIIATVPLRNYFADAPIVGEGVSRFFAWLDALTLPSTGKYTILIDPVDNVFCFRPSSDPGPGISGTVRLYDVPPDTTGTIAASGQPTPVDFTAPGQKATLTFNGFIGQRIAIRALQSIQTLGFPTDIKIYSPGTYPNGTPIFSSALTLDAFMDTTTLTASGTYTILADPAFNKTRGLVFTIYEVPPDVTGTLTLNGPTIPITLAPGQNALLSFSVPSTQTVKVDVGNELRGDISTLLTISFLRSDGSLIASDTNNIFTAIQRTLDAGNYYLKIDPHVNNAGNVPAHLFNP